MAIIRGGIDIGGQNIGVTALSQGRAKGILRKIGILDDGRTAYPQPRDANGEVALFARAIGKANGMQFPVNFKMTFLPPAGINQPTMSTQTTTDRRPVTKSGSSMLQKNSMPPIKSHEFKQSNPNSHIEGGSLDWQTNKMNASTTGVGEGSIKQKYDNAAQIAYTMWDPDNRGATWGYNPNDEGKYPKQESILDLFCSKVTIPEKSIQYTSMRHYGTHFPYPQSVSYGQLTTTFYCDGSMHIKNFFDAWQKLIYNDITGNFNYYDEYTQDIDIYTRTVLPKARADGGVQYKAGGAKKEKNFIQTATAKLDDWTGTAGPPKEEQANQPVVEFRNNYGVKVMQAWPQIVSAIDLGHQSTNSVGEFTVTWVYKKWNTFNLGDVAKRRKINLPTGVAADDATGFPFIRDLPPELSGPLTEGINQGVVTSPLNNFSSLV